ncbi:hypothetical protein SAMN04487830_11462 [Pseudobutyrivibrio sp. OR37]|nr:hypothetical protein SAMN04487830_11462 [Pseudobutyrivibrio sp. OR37]
MTAELLRAFYDKLENIGMEKCIVDTGYKTPAIAKLLLDDGVKPVFPYKSPQTKRWLLQKV